MKLFDTLSNLRTNIMGGGGSGQTTSIARQSAIEMNDTSPTKRLTKDPMAFSTLSYPQDLVNDVTNGHYMLFYINVQNKTKFPYTRAQDGVAIPPTIVTQKYKYTLGDVQQQQITSKVATSGENVSGGAVMDIPISEAGSKNQTKLYGDVANIRKNQSRYRTGLAATSFMKSSTTRITDSVAIYLPPNVQDNYNLTYTNPPTGMLGFLAASAGGATDAYKSDDFNKVAATILGVSGAALQETLKNLGIGAVESLMSSEGGYGLANKIFGRATNPYMEVLFSGPELRTFTYNFTFAPRSLAEQDEVKKIIHLFRFHMAPELRQGANMFMGLPATFDIHYMYQHENGRTSRENDYYNKIATCVLNSCSVDYTPGKVQSHEVPGNHSLNGGAPVKITMGLVFTETEMITKDHVEAGY